MASSTGAGSGEVTIRKVVAGSREQAADGARTLGEPIDDAAQDAGRTR